MTQNSLDFEYLPPRAREMASIIGLNALEKLVGWRGGVVLYVPLDTTGHELENRIGKDAARRLAEHYGAGTIEVPRCHSAIRQAINVDIVNSRRSGETEAVVALRYGVTGRWVRMLCARDIEEEKQIDLW